MVIKEEMDFSTNRIGLDRTFVLEQHGRSWIII